MSQMIFKLQNILLQQSKRSLEINTHSQWAVSRTVWVNQYKDVKPFWIMHTTRDTKDHGVVTTSTLRRANHLHKFLSNHHHRHTSHAATHNTRIPVTQQLITPAYQSRSNS